jgi:hypothetical protein
MDSEQKSEDTIRDLRYLSWTASREPVFRGNNISVDLILRVMNGIWGYGCFLLDLIVAYHQFY